MNTTTCASASNQSEYCKNSNPNSQKSFNQIHFQNRPKNPKCLYEFRIILTSPVKSRTPNTLLEFELNGVNKILQLSHFRWKGSTRAPDNNGSYLSKLQYEHNHANRYPHRFQQTSLSKLPKMDFIKACKVARSIKARSIMIGVSSVRLPCIFVIDACLHFDEESLSEAVECLSYGFKHTKMNFDTYLEMAHKIAEKEKELGERTQ